MAGRRVSTLAMASSTQASTGLPSSNILETSVNAEVALVGRRVPGRVVGVLRAQRDRQAQHRGRVVLHRLVRHARHLRLAQHLRPAGPLADLPGHLGLDRQARELAQEPFHVGLLGGADHQVRLAALALHRTNLVLRVQQVHHQQRLLRVGRAQHLAGLRQRRVDGRQVHLEGLAVVALHLAEELVELPPRPRLGQHLLEALEVGQILGLGAVLEGRLARVHGPGEVAAQRGLV